MSSFYLASRISRTHEIIMVRWSLEQMGHHVSSRWIDLAAEGGEHANRDNMTKERRREIAEIDLHDIRTADRLVLFTEAPSDDPPRGNGRLTEFGYALGRHKECWVVGPLENLFLCLDRVLHFENTQEALQHAQTIAWQEQDKRIKGTTVRPIRASAPDHPTTP